MFSFFNVTQISSTFSCIPKESSTEANQWFFILLGGLSKYYWPVLLYHQLLPLHPQNLQFPDKKVYGGD